MQVKATTTMVKALKEHLLQDSSIERIDRVTMDRRTYTLLVDCDLYAHENDYNASTDKLSAIKITYKPECYCMPQYLTTNDLVYAFRNSDRTFNGFIDSVFCQIEC